jgi:monovalent cation:proton antiporter-2 (CPA2) family protein
MAAVEATLYTEGLVLLCGAVVAAPLFKKIGLGTVLGYLAAGIVIGPLLRIITDGEEILHFAELGVVLLLFIIGLELKPSRLWQLRRDIFGLGLVQVMVSALAIIGVAWVLAGQPWTAAIVIGFGLALSSTAFGIQILNERGDLNTRYGQQSFSILLFQDIAIVPILALVPLVAPATGDGGGSIVTDIAITVGAILALLVAGRYLLNPLFQVIAGTGAKEAMIAAALFVVLASGTLMQFAGLSMALGAFIAGVMLAESSYRHELEADIEPFRGILLGLVLHGCRPVARSERDRRQHFHHPHLRACAHDHQGAGDLWRMPGLWFDSQQQRPDRGASAAGRRVRIRHFQRRGGSRRVRPVDGLAAGGDRHHFHGADAAGRIAGQSADAGGGRRADGRGFRRRRVPTC